MNELALFTGAGGGVLGSQLLRWRVVCGVEIDPYCREVLLRRQEEGFIEPFPIWDDVRTFDGTAWRGRVDVVTGGFPCQPFSVAGKRKGESDERNLWPDTIRVIREVRPRWCLLENVPGLLYHDYIRRVFGDLAKSGYDVRWDCISAAAVGAPHRRDRLWIMGYAKCSRCASTGIEQDRTILRQGTETPTSTGLRENLANTNCHGTRQRSRSDTVRGDKGTLCQGRDSTDTQDTSTHIDNCCSWWHQDPADVGNATSNGRTEEGKWLRKQPTKQAEIQSRTRSAQSRVGRVAHGVAYRVDRLKALGNGQVPAVVRAAWELLKE